MHVACGLVPEVEVVTLVTSRAWSLFFRIRSANWRGVISEKIAPERQNQHSVNAGGFEQAQFLRRSEQLEPESGRRMRDGCGSNVTATA